jgi:wyosine [tRNA(Phe)-imidazoG37] synthetase (radical SAM superfamily)
VGPTDALTATPETFFEIEEVLDDVEEALEDGPIPDVMTLAGAGEPTLYKSLGPLLDGLRELADIPILLITNSSLLWRPDVAQAVMKADIIAPSLDAGDEVVFQKLNKPHPDITHALVMEGLKKVTHEFKGEVHLEVMLVKGVNDDNASLTRIAECLKQLRFDRLDINTPVRPPVPERGALPCDAEVLDRAMQLFGPLAQPIGTFKKTNHIAQANRRKKFSDFDKDIREIILRRPCTVRDIENALGVSAELIKASLDQLEAAGLVDSTMVESERYYQISGMRPTMLKPKARFH